MKMKMLVLFSLALVLLVSAITVSAQKKALKGKVCGDPTVKCKAADYFQPFDLPFDTGKRFTFYESEYFYGIILKSKKMSDWGDCSNPTFTELERIEIQEMFPKNKVFALNCVESGTNYYTLVAEQTAFIGVYAGSRQATANVFLKKVQATGKFAGTRVRRMRIGVNGT